MEVNCHHVIIIIIIICAVASIEATEAATSVVFHSSVSNWLLQLKITPVNSNNDEHKEKLFLFKKKNFIYHSKISMEGCRKARAIGAGYP